MYAYLILGAGKQGLAAAYDLIKFGHASRITVADGSAEAVRAAIRKLRKLSGALLRRQGIELIGKTVNGKSRQAIAKVMAGHDAVLSAMPYYLNPMAAEVAVASGLHYCDLGGYFDSTRKIMKLNRRAKKAGVTLVPDCGVAPGLCNSLAVAGMEKISKADEVHIYCGGLPVHPRPPLNYKIVFNLEGVLGNYFGKSYVLEKGRVRLVPSFSGKEYLMFARPLGKLEARTTGGATSTCPWTFRGMLKAYDYKTLRYPGHYDKFETLKQLGLLETSPVRVNGYKLPPQEMFVACVGKRLAFPKDRDLLVMRVVVRGRLGKKKAEVHFDLLDYGDPRTGFTAMQRTTGFSAAIILAHLAHGNAPEPGVIPVEKVIGGRAMLAAARARHITIKESFKKAA